MTYNFFLGRGGGLPERGMIMHAKEIVRQADLLTSQQLLDHWLQEKNYKKNRKNNYSFLKTNFANVDNKNLRNMSKRSLAASNVNLSLNDLYIYIFC